MQKTLRLRFLCILFLAFPLFAQSLETISIVITDPNADLVTVGFVSVADADGKKIIEIELGKKKPAFNLKEGNYTLEIHSPGFKLYKKDFEVKKGHNNFDIKLELEDVKVNIEIEQSEREKRMDEAIGGYLSQREIDAYLKQVKKLKKNLRNAMVMIF